MPYKGLQGNAKNRYNIRVGKTNKGKEGKESEKGIDIKIILEYIKTSSNILVISFDII